MRNSLFVTITILMIIQVLLTVSNARTPGMDKKYHLEVPTNIHENRFPHGHKEPSKGESK